MRSHMVSDYSDRSVCILGLGFVGLTLAAVMADAGFNIIGVEIRKKLLEQLESGNAHFYEPGLDDNLRRAINSGRLSVYDDIPANCAATVYIITVGTPLGPDGRASLDSVTRISEQIAAVLKEGDLVILRSTVKIGTTQNVVRPILERKGKKFSLAFCPERTVEGQAIAELRYLPQIIGAEDLETTNRAAQLFGFITPTVVRVSSPETAEMIKLIDNAKRDVIFAYANEVARMCDQIGISAAEVIRSGRFGYSRTDLPLPGPVGGPCLSKDSHILAESLEAFGMVPEISVAARRVNERQPTEIAAFLKSYSAKLNGFSGAPKIALLGVAFKGQPVTDDVRGTMALPVLKELKTAFPGASFVAYDPVVTMEALAELGMTPGGTLEETLSDARIALVLNNHPTFAAMAIEKLAARMASPGIIYDCWNNFIDRPIRLAEGVAYVALGSHSRPVSSWG